MFIQFFEEKEENIFILSGSKYKLMGLKRKSPNCIIQGLEFVYVISKRVCVVMLVALFLPASFKLATAESRLSEKSSVKDRMLATGRKV